MLVMSTAVASVRTPSNPSVQLHRSVRALIGWMRREDALATVAGPGFQPSEEHDLLVRRACDAVACRTAGIDQTGAILPAPAVLTEHIDRLRDNKASTSYFAEGWNVAVADLSRVCAFQPQVAKDDAAERTAEIVTDDFVSIAAVTLPLAVPRVMAGAFNEDKKSWVFYSANPNLRVIGQAQGNSNGVPIFGFAVSVSSSFMQVASYNGRLLLRDGYHRAYGLLRRGITHAPVFLREFSRFEDLRIPPGMLSQDAFLGSRPPTLADYLNADVSADGAALVTQKVVIIQALEVATVG
jgi:hypothetical protein